VEVCSLRDGLSTIAGHDTQVFGVSVQDANSHKKFTEAYNLNFPLLVDTGRNLSLLFGATDQPTGLSRRITVIIDKEGKIANINKRVNTRTHGKDLAIMAQMVYESIRLTGWQSLWWRLKNGHFRF